MLDFGLAFLRALVVGAVVLVVVFFLLGLLTIRLDIRRKDREPDDGDSP